MPRGIPPVINTNDDSNQVLGHRSLAIPAQRTKESTLEESESVLAAVATHRRPKSSGLERNMHTPRYINRITGIQ